MKKQSRSCIILSVFMLITLVCITCEHQPDNGEYLKTEIWNGLEFRQRQGVTDNQYEIALNKFKKVFNSDSFTDNQRERIKNKIDIIVINGIGIGSGIWSWSSNKLMYISCNSIEDEIEKCLRNLLLS